MAFLGDRVGMRVGRRRITLFGLRPKYTSMVVTVVTGILIVTATMAAMAVVSQDVRTALFKMKKLQGDLLTARTELTQAENHAHELASSVKDLNQQVKVKETEYQGLVSRYQTTQEKLSSAVTRMRQVESQLAQVGQRLQEVTGEYERASANLAQTQSSLEQTEKDLRFAQSRLAPLTAIQTQLTAVVEQLTGEKDRLNREVEALTEETLSLKQGLEGMLGRRMVFHAGEIVLSAVIDCGRSAAEIRQELLTLHLKRANEIALGRGAKAPGDGTDAIRLRPVDLQNAINQLSELTGKAVLRVLSSTNTVSDEPVLAALQVLPDELVFPAGRVIAEARIEANADPNTILHKILTLLEEVNWQAIQQGMASDQQGTVGEVSTWQEVQEVILEVRRNGQAVRIQALAAADTWRAQGPLRVKLVVAAP